MHQGCCTGAAAPNFVVTTGPKWGLLGRSCCRCGSSVWVPRSTTSTRSPTASTTTTRAPARPVAAGSGSPTKRSASTTQSPATSSAPCWQDSNPGTGLTPNGDQVRTWKNRVPGFDLTFSAPKSVSILYALGDPLVRAEVVDATDTAVDRSVSRGWNARRASCVEGRTIEPRRRRRSRSAAPAACPASGSSLQGSGIAPAAPATRNCTRTSSSRTSPEGPTGAGRHSTDRRCIGRRWRPGRSIQSVLRNELSKRLGVEWGPVHDDLCRDRWHPTPGGQARSRSVVSRSKNELARTRLDRPRRGRATRCSPPVPRSSTSTTTLLDEHWLAEAAIVDYGPADIDELLARPTGSTPRCSAIDSPLDTQIAVRALDRRHRRGHRTVRHGRRLRRTASAWRYPKPTPW